MNSLAPDSTDEPRRKRIEALLYIIGGCEVVIKHNRPGEFGSYPPLAKEVSKIQQRYIKRFERFVNGLPEEDDRSQLD
jgi:hypothetical protein